MVVFRKCAVVVVAVLGVAAGVPGLAAPAGAAQPEGIDHFKCYTIKVATASSHTTEVILIDQFGQSRPVVGRPPNRLCNPVEKTLPEGTVFPIKNREGHLLCYRISEEPTPSREVRVENQFGTARLTVFEAQRLCLPTWKRFVPEFPGAVQPPGLDHFKCYRAAYSTVDIDRFKRPTFVGLADQFEQVRATIGAPLELCNPTQKILPTGQSTPITNPEAHLVCFRIAQEPAHASKHVFTKNQFRKASLDSVAESRLCLPTFKAQVMPG